MARILLVIPPLYPEELYTRGATATASKLPSLGVAYIAAMLRKHGHIVEIYDGIAEPVSLDTLVQRIAHFDVVGITAISAYALRCIQLIELCRKNGIKLPLVVGGPHVTAMHTNLLEYGADYAVIGEGEMTMLELVESLASGNRTHDHVPGLVYMDGGKPVYTGRRPMIDPLDSIPMPARDLLPMHLYSTSPARSKNFPSHSMFTSRGCPGICTFCDHRTFGSRIRYFSLERIVEEFFVLRDQYGARDVSVWDDNFTSDKNLVLAVCEELRRKNFGLTWNVESRINMVDRETLQTLKDAGCAFIAYGIESGSQKVLDHAKKGITREEIREKVRMTKEIGIPMRGYFMMGLPGETLEDMQQTIEFAIELDIEVATFTMFLPLPGTLDYRRALTSGTFKDPEYFLHHILPEFNFPEQAVYVPKGMTEKELLKVHKSAYNRYYFRPRMLIRHLLSIRSPRELAMLARSGFGLLKNLLHKTS